MRVLRLVVLLMAGGLLPLTSCAARSAAPSANSIGTEEAVHATMPSTDLSPSPAISAGAPFNGWQPEPGTTWQWQLTGDVNTSWNVEMYDIDLFDTPPSLIDQLKSEGRIVICYFSAGSREDWRPDADRFPEEVLGRSLEGWPGERWLDVRQIERLAPIMLARLDLAVDKGCDGVEPDNVDGFANRTGFPFGAEDQIAYNRWLAEAAHARGLSVGLKNALNLVPALIEDFDWALNEQCFQYNECDRLQPFIDAGKAVFGVEYAGDPADYCPQAVTMGFSWLTKTYDLGDEPPRPCK